MAPKRRTVLRLLGLGAGLGTTGATGRELLSQPGESTEESADESVDRSVDESGNQQSQQSQEDNTETLQSPLAARTTDIMNELAWFATEYDEAIEAYRTAAADVKQTATEEGERIQLTDTDVARLDGEIDRPRLDQGWPYDIWWDEGERRWRYVDIDWQRPRDEVTDERPLSDAGLSALRDTTGSFIDTFESELSPRFTGLPQERAFAVGTIETIAEFNNRGDTAMVVAGLVRLYQHYEAIDSVSHVESSLSDDPIRNRLARYLRSSEPGGTPPLFEVDYRRGRADRHTAYVYADTVRQRRRSELYDSIPLESIDGSTGGDGGIRLQNVLGALKYETDRLDRCFVLVSEWNRPSDGYYSEVLPSQSVFVQRYAGATAAGEARAALFDRSGVAEVDERFPIDGGEQWTPIRFPFRGAPWNAALRQAGSHVLVAGVARRPFRHRNREWVDPLKLSWLQSES